MKFRSTKTTEAEPAETEDNTLTDTLAGIARLDDTSYRRVLAALGREEQIDLPRDLPGDQAGAHLLLWGPKSISLPADAQRELARLTRLWLSDRESEQLLREVAARLEESEEARRKEHVDRFLTSELEFGYTAGLPVADVVECYADWVARTGESPLDDIVDRIGRISLVGDRFRSWVPPLERELRDSRIREFFAECTERNYHTIESDTSATLDDLKGAYTEWSGRELPENFPRLLNAIDRPPIPVGNVSRVHVWLKPPSQRGPAKPPAAGYAVGPSDPYGTNQRTPGAVWVPKLGRWVLQSYFDAVERRKQQEEEALQKSIQAENQRVVEAALAQLAFDKANPQPASDVTQSLMLRNAYAQGEVVGPAEVEAEVRRERERLAEYMRRQ